MIIALCPVSACCTTGEIPLRIGGYMQPVDSRLEAEVVQDGRVTIYELPSCCRPDTDRNREGLLPTRSEEPLFTGLDALAIDNFTLLRNRNFALLTNATGRDRHLQPGLDLMLEAGVRPALVLEPEHGLYGYLDEAGPDGVRVDPEHGLRILSLYSQRRKPDARHLEGIDVIVVDIENLPVRCYTYVSTLTYLLETADEFGVELMILDRPNPYGFWQAQGSYLKDGFESFVSEAPVPFLYSMTPGEYARFMVDLKYPGVRLSIVRVSGYERTAVDAPLRKSWINPSPNIPSLESALVYPGLVFFEGVNFSLGRGTTRPFVYSGAPWLDARSVVRELRALNLPGVEITEVSFRPTSSVYRNQPCRGVQITPVSTRFDALRTGYEYLRIMHRMYGDRLSYRRHGTSGQLFMDVLWGGDDFRLAFQADLPYDRFRETWAREAAAFEELVKPYRLY